MLHMMVIAVEPYDKFYDKWPEAICIDAVKALLIN